MSRRRSKLQARLGVLKRRAKKLAGDATPKPAAVSELNSYRSLLSRRPPRTAVIIAAAAPHRTITHWLTELSPLAEKLYIISSDSAPEWQDAGVEFAHRPANNISQLADWLKKLGPVDIIVDASPGSSRDHEATWRRVFYQVHPGGLYIVDQAAVEGEQFRAEMAQWFSRIASSDQTGAPAPANRRDRPYADATQLVVLSRDHFVIKKRRKHYLKLRDHEVNAIVATREPDIELTEPITLPAGEVISSATTISHESAVPIPWLEQRLPYPAMHLRHYRGTIGFVGNSLVHLQHSILPESFRWHLTGDPSNPATVNISPSFARIPARFRPEVTLTGDFYVLDPQWPGHFGHILTEVVARLWGWDAAKERLPELKVIYRTTNRAAESTVERRLFRAYGIAPEDVVAVDAPVYLESVVSATAMWHNADPHYVHPQIRAVWDRLRTGIADPDAPVYDKIFISRLGHYRRRGCHNTKEVEQFFEAAGFTIVYPETLDLSVQAGVFASARVIAGFAGSGIFNILYAQKLETLILLTHEGYTARNEHLYAALLGPTVHYFWSAPDVPQPDGGWSQKAFDSAWTFDFARNEPALREVLASV